MVERSLRAAQESPAAAHRGLRRAAAAPRLRDAERRRVKIHGFVEGQPKTECGKKFVERLTLLNAAFDPSNRNACKDCAARGS